MYLFVYIYLIGNIFIVITIINNLVLDESNIVSQILVANTVDFFRRWLISKYIHYIILVDSNVTYMKQRFTLAIITRRHLVYWLINYKLNDAD